jgi:hypothetical protein
VSAPRLKSGSLPHETRAAIEGNRRIADNTPVRSTPPEQFPNEAPPGSPFEEGDPRCQRFRKLIALGYSVETSTLLAEAHVPLESIIAVFTPDA